MFARHRFDRYLSPATTADAVTLARRFLYVIISFIRYMIQSAARDRGLKAKMLEGSEMELHELLPDADAVVSLDQEELALRILAVLTSYRTTEFLSPSNFIRRVFGNDGTRLFANPYPGASHQEIETAIREAWAWLRGAALLIPFDDANQTYSRLSRKGRKIAASTDLAKTLRSRSLPKEALHPKIREDAWTSFHRGKLDTAVFEAMKAVEVAVRDASGFPAKEIGTNLMRKAFDPDSGPLTDLESEKAEREARSALFAGAIGSYKNPHSHRYVQLDNADEAIELLSLASHLLRIVDARATAAVPVSE